jgi:peptidoglycan/xylan/chitin deacetylase (PgdA/CDA1 family)
VAIVPAFLLQNAKPEVPVMLAFDIHDTGSLEWCNGLVASLERHDVKATVFLAGNVAEQSPECVRAFSEDDSVDVGSQTYSYADLTSIDDYSAALDEVKKGKTAVDAAGGIDSQLFRAPYGRTDDNIYSMLSRSGILADFSYSDQYNKYYEGQFIRYEIASYSGTEYEPEYFLNLKSNTPVVIQFDNSVGVDYIDGFLGKITAGKGEQYDPKFVNASELAQMQLTERVQA